MWPFDRGKGLKLIQGGRAFMSRLPVGPFRRRKELKVVRGASGLHAQAYWRANIRLVIRLLLFWFIFSFGCGILFADALDSIRIGGFKLGFWFAQQGSIFAFVIIIFIYIRRMDKLDERYKKGDRE